MIKNTYFVAFLLCTILSYGQQITFHKNVNHRASLLEQSLNTDRDSLILESKSKQIQKVEIFNKDYSERIDVYSNKTKIDLKTLPEGNFVIQAKLGEKWIVMYLEKNEDLKMTSSNQKKQDLNYGGLASKHKPHEILFSDQKEQELNYEGLTSKRKSYEIASSDQNELDIGFEGLTSKHTSNKIAKQNNSAYYWVVSESNSSFGSSKSMRLEYKRDLAKLILKNKLELKSNIGKNNKLLVYEIYNRSQFMTKQTKNPKYYELKKSELFNVVPIYASVGTEESDSDY
ncbi:hypothetical protein [Psychroserpens jangbogonensis]|uniref:hypothetical protein n=1 Tax=Psychroserpens jangbogonensis TaxID=1484460 RepID=UPI00053EE9D8|nr:hypothetical protein [Psychroserpens jangbogonensis]